MNESRNIIKLCDFGISRNPKVATMVSTQHTISSVGGTTRWRAPETFDYPPQWTQGSDVFSLSMTLYEIITKTLPFEDEHDDSMVKSHLKEGHRPIFPSSSPSLPWWFDRMKALIESGWNQIPKFRPSCSTAKILNGQMKLSGHSQMKPSDGIVR